MFRYMSGKVVTLSVCIIILVFYFIGVWQSIEPARFDVESYTEQSARENADELVVGYATTTTLIYTAETLLNKNGGYLSNDVLPPSVFLDNMPAWEFGVLEMVRDLSLSMRNEFSRSQSQSLENPYLMKAQPQFNIDHRSWAWPSAEGEYLKGINYLKQYRKELADRSKDDAQFYARADNFRQYIDLVQKRLGGYSQRLSDSVGQTVLNTDLAGDAAATETFQSKSQFRTKTSWWKIDDVFYEARGGCWALIHFLKAAEIDFADVLAKKNAKVSLQQIISELEATQETVWSPMILNGSGFGLVANHSLVMANYISRANAALIDLSELMSQG